MRIKILSTLFLIGAVISNAGEAVKFTIDTEKPLQPIEHFGASDGWSMRHIGTWKPETQDKVAKWLFSTKNDSKGQPEGIGLSIWRFNLGAGSVEQGDASFINSFTRTECFLNADGTYDWNKQQAQRNFLHLAKKYGVDYILAFLNSPPVHFTINGLATNTGRDGTFNLRYDKYDDFAKFLANVVEGVDRHDGIKFDYICPVNEADGSWNWQGPKQEGTPATNREIAKAVREISKEFNDRKLTTQILISESSDYRCMFGVYESGWQRGNEIQCFFDKDSVDTYVGNLPNVPRLIAGHSYWTNTPNDKLRSYRKQLADTLNHYNVNFWQTEVCIMGNDQEIGGGGGFDYTMKTALYVARMVHHDLVYGGARSWSWWRAVGEDYKDGLLRHFGKEGDTDADVKDSKFLWALGNYSRFIRPGAIRISINAKDKYGTLIEEGDTNPTGLMCTAYRNKSGEWVTVLINYSTEDKDFMLSISDKSVLSWKMYRTSDKNDEHLTPVGKLKSGKTTKIPARSIVTFISQK